MIICYNAVIGISYLIIVTSGTLATATNYASCFYKLFLSSHTFRQAQCDVARESV